MQIHLGLLAIGLVVLAAGAWTFCDPRPAHRVSQINERLVRWQVALIGLQLSESDYDLQRRLTRWAIPASLVSAGAVTILLSVSWL